MEQYTFVRLHAREGEESAVEEAGCLSFHTFRSMRNRRLFYIHSRWVDEAAFQAHAGLPHTIRFIQCVEPLIDNPLDVTRAQRIS